MFDVAPTRHAGQPASNDPFGRPYQGLLRPPAERRNRLLYRTYRYSPCSPPAGACACEQEISVAPKGHSKNRLEPVTSTDTTPPYRQSPLRQRAHSPLSPKSARFTLSTRLIG